MIVSRLSPYGTRQGLCAFVSDCIESLPACRSRQDLLRTALVLAPELKGYLTRKGTRPSDAQDLMQEVYIRILKVRNPQAILQPKAYLYKVAASVAYEHRLRTMVHPPHVTFDEGAADELIASGSESHANAPESHAALAERLSLLATRLNELPPRVRDAVLWHHRDGYTCDEIAERLSAATHRVKKYLVRGLAHCRADDVTAAV
jgi:RNA polymerase sigma-70 factor (ECF subfamily)